MIHTETKLPLSREAALELSQRLGEPQWMRDLRLAAWDTYEALPMPTLQDEEWRRTNLRSIKLDRLTLATPNGASALPAEWLPPANALETRGGLLVQRDGTPSYQSVGAELAATGVILTDLNTAVREHGDLVRRAFMTEAVKPGYSKFAALNGALWSGGTFLYVPANVEVSLPLQSVLWLDEGGLGVFPHTIVLLEHHSSVTLIEESGSRAADGALNVPVVELIVREGAKLRYISIQEFDESPNQIGMHRAVLARDSELHSLTATLGGKLCKLNVDTELQGPGTRAEMLGFYFGSGKEIIDFHTLQDHQAPNAFSDLLFKGVLRDTARSVFSGLIRVHVGAQKTDAYQKNNNLILSPNARADSIPNLEIAANDVRCSHGATAGRVSEEQLFYLMARGLRRREAERMIVAGFFKPLIDRIPLEDLQQRLYAVIDNKMAG